MDDEKKESEKWMRDFAKKMIHGLGLITLNKVRFLDKYSGAEAWVAFYGNGNYTVTIADEFDAIFVEAFPTQNHNQDEVPGWIGSVQEWRKIVRSSEFRRVWLKHVLTGYWEVYRVERK
jgi:hypothetical protein